jgi:DNA-binding CsgD family transcriptional regulator
MRRQRDARIRILYSRGLKEIREVVSALDRRARMLSPVLLGDVGEIITNFEIGRSDGMALNIAIPQSWMLTEGEERVVSGLVAGLRPAEIAASLGLSVHTIRTHLKRAMVHFFSISLVCCLLVQSWKTKTQFTPERRSE